MFFTLGDVLVPLLGPRAGKGDEIGATMEIKNRSKALKKGIENYFFFLVVPFGAQGVPGITFEWILVSFLSDLNMIFNRCVKLLLAYPRSIFYHALSFFATLSGPPCHYRL